MDEIFKEVLCRALGASDLVESETLQSLWSGYGRIVRCKLVGGTEESVVVKLVQIPDAARHPRGWSTDRSQERKIKSYQVETAWYRDFSERCGVGCRVPRCFAYASQGSEVMIALEDLDAAGFEGRQRFVNRTGVQACLRWLANFHAEFMGEEPVGLWSQGTYWHLDTRPDELAVLDELPLKAAAGAIDGILNDCRFRTLVHGDAKLENFCFSDVGDRVAAVDFQYVGGGCGMKDVAYFVGSCMDDTECGRREAEVLDEYFASLRIALDVRGWCGAFGELEAEWRGLYAFAWADFHRFLKGWSPGHWKVNSYSEGVVRSVLLKLGEV